MEISNCLYCGKQMEYSKSRNKKYCCLECCYKDRIRTHVKTCKYCGKEFHYKSKEQQFCSRECVNMYQTTLVGELSPKYKHADQECEWCGKVYSVKQSKVGRTRFCSWDCRNKWFKQYKNTPEQLLISSLKTIDNLSTGKIAKALTKPHVVANQLLDNLNIQYINEYAIKYYSIDIYLPTYNLMIEVMGDYWHSNPDTKYRIPKTEPQKNRVGKDKAKHNYVLNNYKIELLYLWEHDLIDNPELCKQLIQLYVDNDGLLDDYHSFNYHIADNSIELNELKLIPVFAS